MKWKRVVAVFSAAALLVTSLSGCLSTDPTKKKIIRIGVFEPLTGENGGGGFQEVLGMRYANKMYPTVTIQGEEYKVELDEVDNKSDKTEAITAAQRLVSDW